MRPATDTWYDAVQRTSLLAQARLGKEREGHIQRATGLVLDGHVWLEEDGSTCQVFSQKTSTWYEVETTCQCEDFKWHPETKCKHQLARIIYYKAVGLLTRPEGAETEGETGTPRSAPDEHHAESPSGIQIPAQWLTTIQGVRCIKYAGLLHLAHAQGLTSLAATFTYNDADLSLAHAVARFADGRTFEDSGDSTPKNAARVKDHWRRMSLTRAKARALRDALAIDMCSVEEMDGLYDPNGEDAGEKLP